MTLSTTLHTLILFDQLYSIFYISIYHRSDGGVSPPSRPML